MAPCLFTDLNFALTLVSRVFRLRGLRAGIFVALWTFFHLGNRDEISHMNARQNPSRLPGQPGNRAHMKRPLVALTNQNHTSHLSFLFRQHSYKRILKFESSIPAFEQQPLLLFAKTTIAYEHFHHGSLYVLCFSCSPTPRGAPM